MYLDFSVSEVIANFSEKAVTIATNFTLDKTTVNTDTVKFFRTIDGKNEFITDYALSCNGKNITIELSDYPYEDEEFYLFVRGVRDKLGDARRMAGYLRQLSARQRADLLGTADSRRTG